MNPLARHAFLALTTLLLAPAAQAIVGGLPTMAFKATGIGLQVTDNWVLTVNRAALGAGSTYSNGYGSRTVLARYDAPGADGSYGFTTVSEFTTFFDPDDAGPRARWW